MNRQGFIDFNSQLSAENSGKAAIKRGQTKVRFQYAEREQARPKVKASSYAMAIRILDEVLVHQSVVDLNGQSLYDVHDMAVLDYYDKHFGIIAWNKLSIPTEYLPNRDFLAYRKAA